MYQVLLDQITFWYILTTVFLANIRQLKLQICNFTVTHLRTVWFDEELYSPSENVQNKQTCRQGDIVQTSVYLYIL